VRTDLVPLGLWRARRAARGGTARSAAREAARGDTTRTGKPAGVESRSEIGLARATPAWPTSHPGAPFLLSLAVYNLFDRRFSFQNTDFSGNPRVPLFHPERTVLLQANLRF